VVRFGMIPIVRQPEREDGQGLVFLSYSHSDAEWVRKLRMMLDPLVRNRGLRLWADDHIPAGDDWEREIEDGVRRSRLALVVVSGDYLASRFIMGTELPALIDGGVRLAPMLLRDCMWEDEPRLARLQWAHDPGREGQLVDGQQDARITGICRKLRPLLVSESKPTATDKPREETTKSVAAISSGKRVGGAGALDGVPGLPPGYRDRPELDELIAKLLGAGSGALGLTGDAKTFGLSGQGGIGKSVLAAALARDARVREAFPDGVWWVTLGEDPDTLAVQIDLLTRLGAEDTQPASMREAKKTLERTLAERNALLIVDDAWSDATAHAFRVTGAQSRVLYTTRDETVLDAVGASRQTVQALPHDEARAMLTELCGTPSGELPENLDEIVETTGRIPLALALVAAAVRAGVAWPVALNELKRGEATFAEHPYADTFKALQVATRALPEHLTDAYFSLAVFPRDTRTPVTSVARYWRQTQGIGSEDTAANLRELAGRHLLELDEGAIAFHDLQHDYLLLYADDLPLRHAELLAAYRQLLPTPGDGWWQLPAAEPYIADQLVQHLAAAGERDALLATLTDLAYLAVRIVGAGAHAAEADLRIGAKRFPGDTRIAGLRQWLAQNAHLFNGFDTAAELAPTMLSGATSLPAEIDSTRLSPILQQPFLERQWSRFQDHSRLIRVLTGHTGAVRAVAFSPDGLTLATASDDFTVRVWDLVTGTERLQLTGHAGAVFAVAFSPDGVTLASASEDHTVRLWDPVTGTERLQLTGHTGAVRAVAFSPDGVTLASASEDSTVRLWDQITGTEQLQLPVRSGMVLAIAFSPTAQILATTSTSSEVCLWDSTTGAEQAQLTTYIGWASAVAFSPDGQTLATTNLFYTVQLWDPVTGTERAQLTGHTGMVSAVAFSPDGQALASAGGDGTVRLWDSVTGTEQAQPTGYADEVSAVAFSPDGQALASANLFGAVQLWDSATGTEQPLLIRQPRGALTVAFSPNGQCLAIASDDSTVRLWDPVTGSEQIKLTGHKGWVGAVAFSPDGQTLATVSTEPVVRLWDAVTGTERLQLTGHTGAVFAVAFSPDGVTLASAGGDSTVRLWDAVTGTERLQLTGHAGAVYAVAFSPNGVTLASAGEDHTVRLWDPVTGTEHTRLTGHTGAVRAVAFSPADLVVATAGDDHTVRLWDFDGTELSRLDLGSPILAIVWKGSLLALSTSHGLAAFRIRS
jgi:WD40 repeat protein